MMYFKPAALRLRPLLTFLVLCDVVLGDYDVRLQHVTTLKIPVYDDVGNDVFKFDSDSVRKMSFDAHRKLLYVTGASQIHYLNVSNTRRLSIIGHTSFPDLTIYDIKTCGDDVMATYTKGGKSGFLMAKGYNTAHQFPITLQEIIYDAEEPRSLALTTDCQTAAVAVSGKAYFDKGLHKIVDPRGAIIIISVGAFLVRKISFADAVKVLDFRHFDKRSEELEVQRIHFPMRGRVEFLSQDLDPAYVAIDEVSSKAYVSLQVNNAVAEVDIVSKNITKITSLGLKDWRELDIDVSNVDGVHFQRVPIYSLYQPGSISILRHSGGTFLFTADAGAKRDYSDSLGWSEAMTGSGLLKNNLVADSVEPQLVNSLKDDLKLGSLLFTTAHRDPHNYSTGTTGTNQVNVTNSLTKFVTYGGRSFSLRQLPDLNLIFDSGSDLEKRMSTNANSVFNAPVRNGSNVIEYDRDLASVDKGPEAVSVQWGKLGSLTLLALGLNNPGGVLLYSMPLRTDVPKFESFWIGLADPRKTWNDLYFGRQQLAGIGVSDMIFVPTHMTGSDPYLFVAGSKSGTVSFLKVKASGIIPSYHSDADAVTVQSFLAFSCCLGAVIIVMRQWTSLWGGFDQSAYGSRPKPLRSKAVYSRLNLHTTSER